MNNLFDNHKYDPTFISRFVHGKLETKELEEFTEHYPECNLCLNEIHEQIDFLAYAEAVNLKGIIKESTEKKELSHLTINQILEDITIIEKMGEEFLIQNYPETDLNDFKTTWKYFFENIFDWDKADYKINKVKIASDLSQYGMGFSSDDVTESKMAPGILAMIIAEIKKWIVGEEGQKSKNLKSDLLLKMKKMKFPEGLLYKLINYLFPDEK